MSSRIDMANVIIEKDEAFREIPYYCSENYPTIGHGFRIEGTGQHDPLPEGMKISHSESLKKLLAMTVAYDTKLQIHDETKTAYSNANDVQKAVMLSMVHQLGIYRFLKFKKFLSAARNKDWSKASSELVNSLAYKQTPNRWKRNAAMIQSGDIHNYYV